MAPASEAVKVLSNSSSSYVGGLAIVEGSEKDQVAGLELTEAQRKIYKKVK